MPQWRKNLYVLWAGTLAVGISFSFVSPFLPLFLEEMGVTKGLEAWSSALYSAAFLSSCILSPLWGSLADRYGRKVMLLRAGIGMGIVNILTAFATTPMQLLILRLLNGVVSGFIPSAVALVATNTPEEHVGVSLGTLKTGSALGTVIGPLVGGLSAHYIGIRNTFLAAGLTLWIAAAVVAFGVHEIAKPLGKGTKVNVFADIRVGLANKRFATLMVFVCLNAAAVVILQPILTPYIMSMTTGDASLATGIVFSLTGVATVIAAPIWSRRGSSIGYQRTLAVSLILSGVMNIPQILTNNIVFFSLFRFLYGLVWAGAQISQESLTATTVDRDFRGRAFGISQSFQQLGSVVGPLIGGLVSTAFGIKAVFALTAVSLLAFGFGVRRLLGTPETAGVATAVDFGSGGNRR